MEVSLRHNRFRSHLRRHTNSGALAVLKKLFRSFNLTFCAVAPVSVALGFMIVVAVVAAEASPSLPQGSKTISLIASDGTRQDIGHVTFTAAAGEGAAFDVRLDAAEFSDEFLSMRPFRCLSGRKEMWCHLAYPYDLKRQITVSDLGDLEYALLFLFKPPAGYGIDAWNGLYFTLSLVDDGSIAGKLHEADFNVLASPPEAGVVRPISASALTAVGNNAHRFARLEIK